MGKVVVYIDPEKAYDAPPSWRFEDETDEEFERKAREAAEETKNLKAWPPVDNC